jgi:hypothetical protein
MPSPGDGGLGPLAGLAIVPIMAKEGVDGLRGKATALNSKDCEYQVEAAPTQYAT